ncbi:peptidoglycan-binding protein LysM, partial [Stenotrophomonas maltophilia]
RLQQGPASKRVTPARGPASRYIIDAPTPTRSVRGTVFPGSAGDGRDGAAPQVQQGQVQGGHPPGPRMGQPGQATRSAR